MQFAIKNKSINFSDKIMKLSTGDYFSLLLLILCPITTILLLNIQGSTPAFILIAVTFIFPLYGLTKYLRYLSTILIIFFFHICFLILSLSGYIFSQPDLSAVREIRQLFILGPLRISHITQSVYFLMALSFACYIFYNFKSAMIKWSYIGILFLAIYGLYEFLFFAIFGFSGDFLSNRVFGDIIQGGQQVEYLNGSLVQNSLLFGDQFMRLKSLTGEPSMYSLTTVPFCIYAYKQKMNKIFFLLILTLFLSQSTTAIIGIIAGLIVIHYKDNKYTILGIPCLLFFTTLLYFTFDPFYFALNKLIFEKLSSDSGVERWDLFIRHIEVIADGNLVRLFFGLGFGTLRSTDMFSNITSNTGLLGLLTYSTVILLPVFMMKKCNDRVAIQAALVSIYVMEMLTVSEYSYLPPWFFIALGYVRWLRSGRNEVTCRSDVARQRARSIQPAAMVRYTNRTSNMTQI
jgi:hypothetical protein